MDLPTYLRMCVSRLVRERGIPFHMHLDDAPMMRGIRAMQQASMIAREQGIADMSLDEINAEITATRESL